MHSNIYRILLLKKIIFSEFVYLCVLEYYSFLVKKELDLKKKLIVLLVVCSLVSTFFAETTNIKYGYLKDGSIVKVDDKGEHSGYMVAFFEEASKYLDIKVEYIPFNSSTQMREGLEVGLVNLISIEVNPYREYNGYQISDYNELSCNVSLLALKSSPLIHCDYKAFNGKAFGLIKESSGLNELQEYERQHNFITNHVFFDTQSEMRDALHNGFIDAMVSLDIRIQSEEKNIGDINPYYIQFTALKENQKIIDQLDYLRTELNTVNEFFITSLKDYYFGDILINEFCIDEINLAKSVGTITIGYQDNYAPLSFYDEKTKTDSGVLCDIIKEIGRISGLTIELVPLTIDEMKKITTSEFKYDMLSGVNVLKYNTKRLVSNSYYDSLIVDVMRKNTTYSFNSPVVIALSSGTARTSEFVSKYYSNATIVNYQTYEECFDAVKKKQADITYIEQHVGYPLLATWKYSDLRVPTNSSIPCSFRFIPSDSFIKTHSKDDVATLITIINKSILMVEDSVRMDSASLNTVFSSKEISTADYIYRYNYILLIVAIFFCMLIIISFSFIKYKTNMIKNLESKNADLRDSIAFVEKANKAKVNFLAQISHEIRTPLNAIVGLSNLLRRYVGNYDKTIENIDQIEYSSHALLNIINDILDISALENKSFTLSNTAFDLTNAVMGIADLYYPLCNQKNVKFDLIISGFSRNLVLGDSTRLVQVLNNLMSNALKYTDQGGSIEIIVNQVKIEDKRVFVQFAVKDTGCGIEESRLEQIFDPFDHEMSINDDVEGAGLGLCITKNIVNMMQGSIEVDSKVGVGSTFAVTIPFMMSDRNIEETENLIKKLSILVVDNDILCLDFFKEIFISLGVEKFDLVESGEEALALMDKVSESNENYDMVFSDWKMSGTDGFTVLKNAKITFGDECFSVLISAYGTNELSEIARKGKCDMFISKPIQTNQIKSVLMQYAKERFVQKPMSVSDYDFTGRKVLIVDNNRLNLKVEESLLEVVGIEVVCAEGGQEAFDTFVASEPGTFDLILMDIQMPNVDGLESTRMIRKSTHKEATTIPIIAITAYAFTENISASFAAGMNDHLSKPVSALELYETLAKYL